MGTPRGFLLLGGRPASAGSDRECRGCSRDGLHVKIDAFIDARMVRRRAYPRLYSANENYHLTNKVRVCQIMLSNSIGINGYLHTRNTRIPYIMRVFHRKITLQVWRADRPAKVLKKSRTWPVRRKCHWCDATFKSLLQIYVGRYSRHLRHLWMRNDDCAIWRGLLLSFCPMRFFARKAVLYTRDSRSR